jgi:hypothetical protein
MSDFRPSSVQYNPNDVITPSLDAPNDYLHVQANANDFGGQVASAETGLGQSVQSASGAMSNLIVSHRQAVATQADNEAQNYLNDFMYGSKINNNNEIENTGFMYKQGQNALNEYTNSNVPAILTAKMQSIADTLPDEDAKNLFYNTSNQRLNMALQKINEHTLNQAKEYKYQTNLSSAQTAMQSNYLLAMNSPIDKNGNFVNPDDNANWNNHLNTAYSNTLYALTEKGYSQSQSELEAQKVVNQAVSNKIVAMSKNDPESALNYANAVVNNGIDELTVNVHNADGSFTEKKVAPDPIALTKQIDALKNLVDYSNNIKAVTPLVNNGLTPQENIAHLWNSNKDNPQKAQDLIKAFNQASQGYVEKNNQQVIDNVSMIAKDTDAIGSLNTLLSKYPDQMQFLQKNDPKNYNYLMTMALNNGKPPMQDDTKLAGNLVNFNNNSLYAKLSGDIGNNPSNLQTYFKTSSTNALQSAQKIVNDPTLNDQYNAYAEFVAGKVLPPFNPAEMDKNNFNKAMLQVMNGVANGSIKSQDDVERLTLPFAMSEPKKISQKINNNNALWVNNNPIDENSAIAQNDNMKLSDVIVNNIVKSSQNPDEAYQITKALIQSSAFDKNSLPYIVEKLKKHYNDYTKPIKAPTDE